MTDPVRILHVDDDPGFVALADEFLEREGFEVVGETRATDGLARLRRERIDCVVSDHDVPGIDGLEFLEAVREDYPDLPFVLYTGTGSEAVASDAISAGVTEYLRKGGGTDQYAVLANRIGNVVGRRRAAREAERTRTPLQAVAENSTDAIVTIDDDGRIRFANPAVADLFGHAPADLEGEPIETILPARSDGDPPASITPLLETGEGTTDRSVVEFPGRHRDGHDVPLSISIGAFEHDDRCWTVVVLRDVTDRTGTAPRSPARGGGESRIEALHAGTRGLMAADTEAEVARLTVEAARNTLEFPFAVFRIREGDRLEPVAITDEMRARLGSDRPAYRVGQETAGHAFAVGETVVYDDVSRLDDGIERSPGASMYVPVGDYGVLTISGSELAGYDESDVDVAELLATYAETALDRVERTQELRRQNERLDEFASIVAHDLRNPLSVLDGSLDLAEEHGDAAHFDRCRRSVDRMAQLTDDLLSMARRGDLIDDPDDVALAPLAETCWTTVETGGAILRIDGDGVVRADEGRLKEVFENLFRNSVEHGSTGGRIPSDDDVEPVDAPVTVTVGDLDDGFFVADDGPGIPSERREGVFEPGHSTGAGGTGLGLTIVRRIADAHGWTVSVDEGSDGGARFAFEGVERTTSADRSA